MPEHHKRTLAIAAANKYAPRPQGSAFTYGLVAIILAFLMLVIFGMFYDVEVLAHPVAIGAGFVPVFLLGVLLWRRRRRLHHNALNHELSDESNYK